VNASYQKYDYYFHYFNLEGYLPAGKLGFEEANLASSFQPSFLGSTLLKSGVKLHFSDLCFIVSFIL
jgi:hypothetical protein